MNITYPVILSIICNNGECVASHSLFYLLFSFLSVHVLLCYILFLLKDTYLCKG